MGQRAQTLLYNVDTGDEYYYSLPPPPTPIIIHTHSLYYFQNN